MLKTCISPETKFATEEFRYLGRTWRLFKRAHGAAASWYFLIERQGRRYPTSLRTGATVTAIAQAKLLIDAAHQQKLAQVRAILSGRTASDTREFCTVDKYLQIYENTPTGENSARSRHHFVLAFRRLMTRVENPPARMDELERLFKQARAKANADIEAAKDNADIMRLKRSFSSEVANAASVISERAVFVLKDQLVLPDFTELRQLIKHSIRFPAAKKTAGEYNPPKSEILDATIKGWLELARNEFLAVGLALACGMRRGEMRGEYDQMTAQWTQCADWSWFKVHNGYQWCDGTGNFKDGTATLRTQVLNPFWDLMMERVQREGWDQTGSILVGNRSEFDKNISAWMKSLGWETRLHLHALRAWAGSLVFMKYGEDAACAFCRHADKEVTRDSYGWLKQDWHTADSAVLVNGQPVEWVKATPPPSPGNKASAA